MDFATVYEGRDSVDAHLIAIALEEDGIECHVDDAVRWDDFAVAQRLMNTTEIKVLVNVADEARAKATIARVLAERAARREQGEVEALVTPTEGAARRSRALDVFFWTLIGVPLLAMLIAGFCTQR